MTDNILFISDTSNGGNWGCYETSKQLRSLLSESVNIRETIFLNKLRNPPELTVRPSVSDIKYLVNECKKISYGSSPLYKQLFHHGFRSGKRMFSIYPQVIDQFDNKAEKFLNSDVVDEYFNNYQKIDQVVINGEGSIHGTYTKPITILFLSYIFKIKLNTPTHIINHTLHINNSKLEKIVESIYPQLDSIAFRETMSAKKYISKIGDTGNIIRAADAAWMLDSNLTPSKLNALLDNGGISMWAPNETKLNFDFTEPFICISGGSGFGHRKKHSQRIMNIIASLLDKNMDINILLTAAAQHDEDILLPVAERLNLPLVKINNSSVVGASIVGNSDLYLGGRWHETIFALLNKTQVVNFEANTFKMKALKQEVGGNYPIYSPSNINDNVDSITRTVVNKLSDKEPIDLSVKISQLRKKAKKNLVKIDNLSYTHS